MLSEQIIFKQKRYGELKWAAENFKGLGRGELDLNPGQLTVLAGANSSGKSSLLQSLLMVSQSLQQSGPVVLNGSLTRLGEANDLLRTGAGEMILELQYSDSARRTPAFSRRKGRQGKDETKYQVKFHLKPNAADGSLKLNEVFIQDLKRPDKFLHLSTKNSAGEDVNTIREYSSLPDSDVLHIKSTLGDGKKLYHSYIEFLGLEPIAFYRIQKPEAIHKSVVKNLQQEVKNAKSKTGGRGKDASLKSAREDTFLNSARNYQLLDFLYDALAEGALPEQVEKLLRDPSTPVIDFVPELFMGMESSQRDQLFDALGKYRAQKPYLYFDFQNDGYIPQYSSSIMHLGYLEQELYAQHRDNIEALALLRQSLNHIAHKVQYLGPLRDEPRVVWSQWTGKIPGLPVGVKGEYSADYLARHAGKRIEYWPPNSPLEEEHHLSELSHAVNEWLAYLKIGEKVTAERRGKLGVALVVTMDGERRDLTSVGVGVSQALPLVIALLTIPRGSIFIIEQPELHLHPAVQARLADLIMTARRDVSIVVETHSEAFLTRIRRRVAENNYPSRNINVTFVEPTAAGSITRELAINNFGDLSEWPAGFFEDDGDIQAIMKANVKQLASRDVKHGS